MIDHQRGAAAMAKVPLEWCCGPGVRLDFRSRLGRDITVADIREQIERTAPELRPHHRAALDRR